MAGGAVPSVEEEDARQLHRELETLRREQTSHSNRIKGLLSSCGVTLEVDRELPRRLKKLRLWDGSVLAADLQRRLLREFERMQVVNRQIRQLEKERACRIRQAEKDPAVAQVRTLLRLKGIGINSSWLYVREVFGWRELKNRRQVGAIVGLTGSPYRSGSLDHEQGISKAGNRRMRAMAIEIAWGWLFHQPQSELSQWYQRRFAHGGKRLRRIGIVAVARKLLVALWRYIVTKPSSPKRFTLCGCTAFPPNDAPQNDLRATSRVYQTNGTITPPNGQDRLCPAGCPCGTLVRCPTP